MERNLNGIMPDKTMCYYGHGTVGEEVVINSIFKYGLRCSHNDMYYTTIPLGIGGAIGEEAEKLFDRWPHHDFENIIIVSLPIDFHILDVPDIGTYQEQFGAFCYTPSEEMQKRGRLTNSRYVRPEFVMGCYNTKKGMLKLNKRYYKMMYPPKREELFNEVKSKYLNIIDNGCGIREYKEILDGLPNWNFPLTDEEINALKK